jgi:hypothetical protein
MSDQKKQPSLEIQLDNDVAQGTYANLAIVNHTDAEVTLDFIYVQPQEMKGKVRSRIIVSPRHAKRLLHALKENVERYEQAFGEIPLDMRPEPAEVTPYH